MIILKNRNIISLMSLFVSMVYTSSLIPTADAGSDTTYSITECDGQDIIISIDGSNSNNLVSGVCDAGVCSSDNKYCTTSLGPTSDLCDSSSDCGDEKICIGGYSDGDVCTDDSNLCGLDSICVGGDSDGVVCTNDPAVCGDSELCEAPGSCGLLKECVSEYSYKEYCEASGNSWISDYKYIDEPSCESLYGTSNNYWYDLTLDFNWTSDEDSLLINNSASSKTDVVLLSGGGSEAAQFDVYLTVQNQFEFSVDTLSISLDPKRPCAVAGDDLNLCRACNDQNSSLYNDSYISDIISTLQLNASESYSDRTDNFEYLWSSPSGFTLSSPSIADPSITVDFDNVKQAQNIFTLQVTNIDEDISSILDTVVVYMNPSRPSPPKVEAYPENDKITLNWERGSSFSSIDSLTGYSDFEGYRVYKSIDGGETWGSADDRIFYDGSLVGWRHQGQVDLSTSQDSIFCTNGVNPQVVGDGLKYSDWERCVEDTVAITCCRDNLTRKSSVRGLDPYAPWVNVGSDGGLEYSYIDTSVYNGKEYTYAVVAFDMGLLTYEQTPTVVGVCDGGDNSGQECHLEEEDFCDSGSGTCEDYGLCSGCVGLSNTVESACCAEGSWEPIYSEIQSWDQTNPGQFTYDGINGYRSLESERIDSINVVTVIPAFYAENVENISDFDDVNKDFGVPAEDRFMNRVEGTVGNGGIYFEIVNPDNLTDNLYQFEISADNSSTDIFEGYRTENPSLYVWKINKSDSSFSDLDYSITSEDLLTHEQKCALLNLPGAYVDGSCSRSSSFCESGSKDGKECTYKDVGYCTGGSCVEAEIDYLDSYYSCVCDDASAQLSGASGALNGLADSYNDWLSGGDTIKYPLYEIEDFPIKYFREDGYDENYTEFFDGIKVIFNNNVKDITALAIGADGILGTRDDGEIVVKKLQSYDKNGIETDLSDFMNIRLEYGNEGDVFNNKPSYSYRIDFSSTPSFESALTFPTSGCSGRPNSLLPFEITNTTTNQIVGVYHTDNGTLGDKKNDFDSANDCISSGYVCGPDEYCNDEDRCEPLKGYGDCSWSKNERASLKLDLVRLESSVPEEEYTFDLKINYVDWLLYSKGVDPQDEDSDWVSGSSYVANDVVSYNNMFWRAASTPDPAVNPAQWVDDGSGNNVNPWEPVYPWDDGDYVIIEPTRWYVNGDSWIADLSQLGKEATITEESLKKISVVPNPYIVYSDYDETSTSRRLWFNHLPNRCRITIYTISGERVASMLHEGDDLSGKESWDVRSQSGDLVAPGLYIYTVESEGANKKYIKHVSKFAIIR